MNEPDEIINLDLCVCLGCGLRYNECTCYDNCLHVIMTGHTPHSASYCRICGEEF
jgi:hypothetical protein